MNKIILLTLGIIFVTNPVFAGDYIACDPNDLIVVDKVIDFKTSIDGSKFKQKHQGKTILFNPNLSSVKGVSQIYWKCKGRNVVKMSNSEITLINNTIKQKNVNSILMYDIDMQDLINTLAALEVINKAKFDAELIKQMGLQ